QILRDHHAFYPKYQQTFEILSQARQDGASETDLAIHLHFNSATDHCRYNLPTTNEIAVILPGDDFVLECMHDIILHLCGGPLERIHKGHPAYLPLHYVLLFPYSELGWHSELQQIVFDKFGQHAKDQSNAPCLTQMDFYSFRLFSRHAEFSTIPRGGKLFQEFLVNAWASTEQNQLRYLHNNQATLRANVYQGLADTIGSAANEEINLANLGQRIILPSTHLGSSCYMFEIFQDSMAITRFCHHPDIFGTMTANSNWKEIIDELLPGQTSADRPNLVAHRIVCAKFPDQNADPLLFDTIIRCMVHGLCGARNSQALCMQDGICQKKYPKEFRNEISIDSDGYPLYARRL
ncbi:20509_t:CDS:2, partial [Gigaspora rosea]